MVRDLAQGMRTSRYTTAAGALFLLALNAYICRELFFIEYTRHLGSIEAAYIAISRYAMENWRDLTWFPLWYTGVPYQNTYPPLLHWIVAAVAQLLGISPALSHHAVTAVFYCFGPVALFGMACRLSGQRSYSFAAALVFSVLSPSAFLATAVRTSAGGVWAARRLQTLVEWGEGPHITSITLLPLAILGLHWALTRRRLLPAYLAAAGLAAVVLVNWLGAAALAMAAVAYLLSALSPPGWKTWRDAAGIGLLAYVLAGPWIPPTTLLAIRTNAQKIGDDYSIGLQHLLYLLLVVAAVWGLRGLLVRWRVSGFLQFSLLFCFLTAAVTLCAEWFEIWLLPQPERYHLEMEMALCLAGVFALRPLLQRLDRRALVGVVVVALLLGVWQTRNYRRYARLLITPIDMRATLEYQLARWFDQHFSGRRVMAQGTIAFWMNVFTDTPQLGGGFEQGIVNDMNRHVIYGLYANERAGEGGRRWLKAYGIHAISMGGRRSREFYKPIRDPYKFDGILPVLWRQGDDIVYGVPHRSDSLAHVIRRTDVVPKKPEHALDIEPLRRYVAALDDPALPQATFRWRNRHHASLTADLAPGQLLSIQISYHPGWRALVNGRPTPLQKDHLSQMLLDPGWDGPLTIELTWDGGLEMRLLRWLQWCALLWLVVHKAFLFAL